MKKIVLIISLIIASLVIIGCSQGPSFDDVPEGVPLPPASDLARADDAAVAGQGFATGTYDHEFQFYLNIYDDATSQNAITTIGYCVSCSQAWQYMRTHFVGGYFNWNPTTRQTERILTPLTLTNNDGSDFTFAAVTKNNPNGVGVKYELRSECADYDIEVDGNANYYISRNGVEVDRFTAQLNGYRTPAFQNRQIAGTDDAISIIYSPSALSWMTLHCDDAVAVAVCGNGNLDTGEQCDGVNFGTATCEMTTGAGATGTLSCTNTCTIDSSACTPAAAECPAGQTNCAGACVNTQTNNANCGACGTACNANAGQVCNAGACINTRGTGLHDYIVGSPEPGYTETAGSTITFDVVGVDSDGDRLTLTSDHATVYQNVIDQAAAAGTTVALTDLVTFQIITNEAGRIEGRLTVNSGVLPANLQAGEDIVTFTLSSPSGTNAADPDPVNRLVTVTFT